MNHYEYAPSITRNPMQIHDVAGQYTQYYISVIYIRIFYVVRLIINFQMAMFSLHNLMVSIYIVRFPCICNNKWHSTKEISALLKKYYNRFDIKTFIKFYHWYKDIICQLNVQTSYTLYNDKNLRTQPCSSKRLFGF